jgi:hypothetical protein
LVIVSWRDPKHQLIRYLVSGTTVVSVDLFMFLLIDETVPQTCADITHALVQKPLCVIQAMIFTGGLTWLGAFQVLIAWHLWAAVVVKVRPTISNALDLFLAISLTISS